MGTRCRWPAAEASRPARPPAPASPPGSQASHQPHPTASPRGLRHHAHACTLRDRAKPQSSPHRSVEQRAHAEDGAMGRPSGRRGPLPAVSREHPRPCRAPARSPEASLPAPDAAPPWEQPPAPHGQEHTDTWGSKTRCSLTGTGQGLREPAPMEETWEGWPTTEGAHRAETAAAPTPAVGPQDPHEHAAAQRPDGHDQRLSGRRHGQRAGLLSSGAGRHRRGPSSLGTKFPPKLTN